MNSLTQLAQRTLGKHFVSLSCVQRVPGSEQEKALVFSGFIVEIVGEWFYVTAGHVLRYIRRSLDAGSQFAIWRLSDHTAQNSFRGIAVPYDFDPTHWYVLEDADVGLDYAIAHLGGLYRRQLEAGGVAALAKRAWSLPADDHDHWVLAGIPSESVSYDGLTMIDARFVVAPLVPTDTPALAGVRANNQFYARFADDKDGVVKDVDGMSGGPIFSMKHDGEFWRYGVIGVQSAWYPNSRILVACPFTTFALALVEPVNEALSLFADDGDAESAP